MDAAMDKVRACTYHCAYFQELAGTALFMLLGASFADNAFKIGALYAILYAIFRTQFKGCKALFNPALVMAEVMTSNMEIGAAILMWISQGVGAFVGYVIAGKIGATVAAHDVADFDFFQVAVTEFIGAAVLTWIWLDIHGKSASSWAESFYGFAPGLMYFVAMSLLNQNANLNPAKYEAKWAAASVLADPKAFLTADFWMAAFTTSNITYYFMPILAAFVTSLVYTWYKN